MVALQTGGKIVGVGARGATLSTGHSALVVHLNAVPVAKKLPPSVAVPLGPTPGTIGDDGA